MYLVRTIDAEDCFIDDEYFDDFKDVLEFIEERKMDNPTDIFEIFQKIGEG